MDLAKQAKLDGEVDFLQGMLKSVTSSLLSDVTAMQEDQEREADLQVEPLHFLMLFLSSFNVAVQQNTLRHAPDPCLDATETHC